MQRFFGFALIPLVILALGAAPETEAPAEYTIDATDHEFDAPDEVPAGVATFRLVNNGQQLHHAVLVRLDEGHTVDDLRQNLQEQDVTAPESPTMPSWATLMGGPNAAPPGGHGATSATVPLRPGEYAWLCFVHSPMDGEPHYEKGMITGMTVTAGERPELPEADMLMRLTDYDFELSEPLTPGTHTIRVRNYAAQPHEVVMFKLAPDKTREDLMAFLAGMLDPEAAPPQGPPPGMPVGGVSPIAQGEANNVTLDVTPGDYVLLCVLPAPEGGIHVDQGMIKTVTVAQAEGGN